MCPCTHTDTYAIQLYKKKIHEEKKSHCGNRSGYFQ